MESIYKSNVNKFGDLFLPSLDVEKFRQIIVDNLLLKNPEYPIIENPEVLQLISAVLYEILDKNTPDHMSVRYLDVSRSQLTKPNRSVSFLGLKNFFQTGPVVLGKGESYEAFSRNNPLRYYIPNLVYVFLLPYNHMTILENTSQNRSLNEFLDVCLKYEFEEFLAQFISMISFARKKTGILFQRNMFGVMFLALSVLSIRRLPEKINIPYPSDIYYDERNRPKPHFVETDTLLLLHPILNFPPDKDEDPIPNTPGEGPSNNFFQAEINSLEHENYELRRFIELAIEVVEKRIGEKIILRCDEQYMPLGSGGQQTRREWDQNHIEDINIIDYAPKGSLLEFPTSERIYGCQEDSCIKANELVIDSHPKDFVVKSFVDLLYIFRKYKEDVSLYSNIDVNSCIDEAKEILDINDYLFSLKHYIHLIPNKRVAKRINGFISISSRRYSNIPL